MLMATMTPNISEPAVKTRMLVISSAVFMLVLPQSATAQNRTALTLKSFASRFARAMPDASSRVQVKAFT